MKNKFSILVLLVLLALGAKGQKPDSIMARVFYTFSHIRDTSNRTVVHTENMVLWVGQNASAYKSLDLARREMAVKRDILDQVNSQPGGLKSLSIKKSGTQGLTRTEYYQFTSQKKLFSKEILVNPYIIEESLPVIKWNISKDTMKIAGLLCQKATGHFKGRDYIAWFCADLPFYTGPWKLNGLPGLILEAHDVKNEVAFKFAGFEDLVKMKKEGIAPSEEDKNTRALNEQLKAAGMKDMAELDLIKLPPNAIKTTFKELNELKEAMKKNPQSFVQAATAGAAGRIVVGKASGSMAKEIIENNPIELPEK